MTDISVSEKKAQRENWRAAVEHAEAESKAGHRTAVIPLAKEALIMAERNFGVDDSDTLASVGYLASSFMMERAFAQATPLLVRLTETLGRTQGKEHPKTLAALDNLASNYEILGRFADCLTPRKAIVDARVRALGRAHPDTLDAEEKLAAVYVKLGSLAEAERIYIRVFEERERALGDDDPKTLAATNQLATLLESEGRHGEAERLYTRGLEASERLLGKEAPLTLTFAYGLGITYEKERRYPAAEAMLTRALEGRKRLYGEEDANTIATLGALANLYGTQGKFQAAIPLAKRTVESSERLFGKEHLDTLAAVYNLATLYEYSGHYIDGDPLFARTLTVHERLLGPQHPHSLLLYYALTTNRLSDPALVAGALEPARALIAAKRARRISTDVSAVAQAERDREAKRRSNDFIWFAEAAWYVSEGHPRQREDLAGEAFTALQDAISGLAGKAIGQTAVRQLAERKTSGLGLLIRQRQDLDSRWDANAEMFSATLADDGPTGTDRRSALAHERQALEHEMDRLDVRLRAELPDYFALVRSEPVSLADTQKLLRPDEAILLAVQSTMSTHVIAVSHDAISWNRTHWDKDITAESVKRLLWDVGVDVGVDAATSARWESEGGPGYPYDRKTAYALYQQLIAPVEPVLRNKRHVFIAAGGALSSFPFGILVTERPQGADGDPAALRATKWFVDAHALVTIPSVQSLQYLRKAARRSKSSGADAAVIFAGYGDPKLAGPAQKRGPRSGKALPASAILQPDLLRAGGGMANIDQIRSLASLPGTATELGSMREALHAPRAAVHLQQQATEAAIRNTDLSHVRIIALATHGVMAGELTGAAEPGLIFTPPLTASDQDDGFLSASEVSKMKLAADWVILSACNTAAGDGSDGAPGLSGLARAFFYAGARNLLVSYWPVRDDTAARITVGTIKGLRNKPQASRAEALQSAMRAIRDDASHDTATDSWAHPNAWAPFTLVGDGAQ